MTFSSVATSIPRQARWARIAVVLAGILLGQAILYGPSLLGRRILLPLDVLGLPNVYLPATPEYRNITPHDSILSDLVFQQEMLRQFAVREVQAGRFPAWLPYQFCGVPMAWPRFSPFLLLEYTTASPVILAWTQLVSAFVAGLGMYAFCRRALGLGFWAAAVPAWCYPMTGFLVLSQGYPSSGAIYWFPWLMLAVDRAVEKPGAVTLAAVAVSTALALISGQTDIAAQVMMASGLYGVWKIFGGGLGSSAALAARRTAWLATGWILGVMLASPHVLPLLEYARTGARVERRIAGNEERPPAGLGAIPQTVLPDMNGATRRGSLWLAGGNQIESSAAAYAGLVATLFVAPLMWCSRRHRRFAVFCGVLVLLGVSWSANLPGFVWFLRLPGLNMMSHNRLVFWISFAVLSASGVGLEVLSGRAVTRHLWFIVPAGALVVLAFFCVWRTVNLWEPIATQLGAAVGQGREFGWIHSAEDVRELQAWFRRAYGFAAGLCLIGVAGWAAVLARHRWRPVFSIGLGAVMMADMLWFAYGRSAQCDPALYYPRIPMLEQIARAEAGRVVGFGCLPATLAQSHQLEDVRGYDAIDPAHLVQLLQTAADERSPSISYALTQWLVPKAGLEADGIRLPPVLDLLGVRYAIFRGPVPNGVRPAFQSPDYWALRNPRVLPRAFVPTRVETIPAAAQRLARLGASDFDPAAVALVETPVSLPPACFGRATILHEVPKRISLALDMTTPGLVVLTDRWDPGWAAYLNGESVPILTADHALRGVVVPAGKGTLEFRYEPASFRLGLGLATLAVMVIGGAGFSGWWRSRRPGAAGGEASAPAGR